MAMTVNSNVASLSVQKNLNRASENLSASMQRLSSGLKINSAKDDAAGLQIANRLSSQITGMNVAVKNANDAISIAQTAEGALQESTNILQRMRELSLQASNGSNSADDRASLNQEFQALSKELTRIADTTTFGTGMKLLDGSSGTLSFQVGANANENISFSLAQMDAKSLKGANATATTTGTLFGSTETTVTSTKGISVTGTVALPATGVAKAAAVDQTYADINLKSGTGTATEIDMSSVTTRQGVIDAINAQTATTKVAASLDDNNNLVLTSTEGKEITVAAGSDTATTIAASYGISATTTGGQLTAPKNLVINDVKVDLSGSTNLDDVKTKINTAAVGVTASISNSGKLVLTSADSTPVQVQDDPAATGGMAQYGLTANTATVKKDTSISLNGNEIKFTAGDDLDDVVSKINGAGLGVTAEADNGKLVLNTFGKAIDLQDGANADGTASGGLTALGLKAGTTETASTHANGTKVIDKVSASSIKLNGTEISFAANDKIGTILTKINAQTSVTGVTATKNADGMLVLSANKDIKIEAGSTNDAVSQLGLTVGTQYEEKVSVGNLDVKSAFNAQKSIQVIDSALSQIDTQRAELGAVQNRFDSTIANLQSISENATSARSRVQDADFAAETSEMTKQQTLQQASTAILAQANQLPSAVLKLLG
nr:flagellin hook IN motif-containing protein [Pseudomonas luteola]